MFTTPDPQKNKVSAKVYFDEHLSHNDYYSQGEIVPGRWIGMGAEHLGLLEGQPVAQEDFMRLCDNLHPATGELLTQRFNSNRRVFFDFTCSAPKSVSIMAVTMNDERIVHAHQLASRFALKELEQFAATRIRKAGSQEDRVTGNLVGGEFLHHSSRALDPQLHTHFTLFNATYDSTEHRWKALQTSEMYDAIHYGTEVYRNELARRLHQLGYETVRTADAFEIKGVSQSLCDRFSKRKKECDKVVAEMEQRLGRKISNDEVAHVVHKTRSRKLKGITTSEVRQRQTDQMSPDELNYLRVLRQRANGFGAPREDVRMDEVLKYSSEHVFERHSVVPEHQLLQHALIEGRGGIDLQRLKDKLHRADAFIRVGREYSTREILETELYLIDRMNAGKNAFTPLAHVRPDVVRVSEKLGPDQCEALQLVLYSPDQFTGIRGLAGTGKSTALKELYSKIREAGCEPVVCAPTSSATDVLRQDGFNAMTLQSLLVNPEKRQQLHERSVLILDEAGAVGIDDMKKLFSLAAQSNARVVFSGDTGQHASVARGDALRILEEHSRYSFGQLTKIRRQRQNEYREVVELAANQKPAEAFARLEAMGAVSEHSDVCQKAVEAYLSALDRRRSALLVAPTWAEIEAVTDQVRTRLQELGRVGTDEVRRTVYDSLSWTDAQKCNPARYQTGQVLLFHQASGRFKKHQSATVVAATKDSLRLQLADGATVEFAPRKGASFDVCEVREINIAAGDRLLLQANQRSVGSTFTNGELVEVKSIDNGQIQLTDGRVLPADYRRLCHGYAVTSHASQGKTVDEVFLVASSRSFGAVHQEQFYVSISRGRERCQIFTDDTELLRNRVARSQDRKAAVELVQAMQSLGYKVKEPLEEEIPVVKPKVKEGISPLRIIELIRIVQTFLARLKESVKESVKPEITQKVEQAQKPEQAISQKVEQQQKVKQQPKQAISEKTEQPQKIRPARTIRHSDYDFPPPAPKQSRGIRM